MSIRFPPPLPPQTLIGITAPSSGVEAPLWPRLDLVIAHLRSQGYRVVQGNCLRDNRQAVSAPQEERAAELIRFLTNPEIAAVIPPWGGELATELLELIPFAELATLPPKWLLGYSDISTLLMPLTVIAGWATAHGPNLMDLAPTQTDPLTTSALNILAADLSQPVTQQSSEQYQQTYIDFAEQADAALNLTEPTRWQRLDGSMAAIACRGRLIGGCLDTISWLAGTVYGDVPKMVEAWSSDGTILYLENAGMNPPTVVRSLLTLRRHGWFNGLSGLLIGRNAAPAPTHEDALSYEAALKSVLSDLPYPILWDVDIGHQSPQMTLINGALAAVQFADGGGTVTQRY